MPSTELCEFGLSQEPLNTEWFYVLKHDDFKDTTNGKQVLQNVCVRIYEPSAQNVQTVKSRWQQLAAANQDLTFVNVQGVCMPTLLFHGKSSSDMPGAVAPGRGLSLPAAFPVNEKVMVRIGRGEQPSRGPFQFQRIDPLYNRIAADQGVDQSGGVMDDDSKDVVDQAAQKESSILPVLGVTALGALGIWLMMRK